MKKALSFLLCALLLASCMTGLALIASAEGQVLATLTADDLATTGTGANQLTITKNTEGDVEYATFTTSGTDPYVYYNAKVAEIGQSQFMKITYRTSSACTLGEYFCNSGTFFCLSYNYVNDGNWNTVIIDLTQNEQHSTALQLFRLDPFTGGNAAGCTIDIKCIEFFKSEELSDSQYELNLTTNPFAEGIPSVNIGDDVVLGGTLNIPTGAWTSWYYSINGSVWAPASYEAGENGAFESLTIPTGALSGGIHTVALQARNDNYQSVTLSGTIHIDISTVVVGEGTTGQLFNGGTGSKNFGVHIDAVNGLYSFTIQSLANYGGSTDKMKVEAFTWNTDIATTTSVRPVWSTEVSGITDNGDTTVEIPAGKLTGEIYLQFTPVDGNLTGKAADIAVNSGVEFYVAGEKVEGGFMGYYVAANPAQIVWDLTGGTDALNFLPMQDTTVALSAPGYVKAIETAPGAAITYVDANLNPGFKYVALLYRTRSADATITVNNAEPALLNADGLWNVVYIDLDTTGLDSIKDLAFNFTGSIDVAYIGVYKSTALREASANANTAAMLNRVCKEETVYDAGAEKLLNIGVMNTDAPVFVYDFTLWHEDAPSTYKFTDMVHMSVDNPNTTQGYITFNINAGDPYFTFGAAPDAYANQLRYIVIKYRTTAATKGEFFTGTSGGYQWADPMEKTHVMTDYQTDGQWHTTVADVSTIWGDLYGQTLTNFRFDPIDGSSGTIDIAYIAFYTNAAAAEAAAAADDGVAPKAPVDPATVNAFIFDGEGLFTTMGITDAAGTYNYAEGYMSLTCNGADPSYFLLHNANLTTGPILALRYRTTSELANETHNECFIGKGELSGDDWFQFINPIQNDGEWHVAYVNLYDIATKAGYPGKLHANADGTVTMDYFRFDFLRYPGTLDVAYIGFFNSVDDLNAFDAQIWTAPKFYTLTFMVDDVVVKTVRYRDGSDPTIPAVPAKEGYTGAWESYDMGVDMVVNAIYTEISVETETQTEEITTAPAETTAPTDTAAPEESTAAPADETTVGEAEVNTDPAEEPEQSKGCKAAVTAGAIAMLVSVLALGVMSFKKKD